MFPKPETLVLEANCYRESICLSAAEFSTGAFASLDFESNEYNPGTAQINS